MASWPPTSTGYELFWGGRDFCKTNHSKRFMGKIIASKENPP